MSLFSRFSVNTKYNIVSSLLLMALFMALAYSSYRREQSLILKGAIDNARTLLGLDLKTGGTTYGFGARVAWAHDFAPSATAMEAALSGSPGSVYTVYSSQTGRDAAVVKLSLSARLDAAINGYIEYGGEVRERQTTQTAALGVRWNW